ncbi:MYG1 family protein [Pseudobacteriovorax antillogorgiicola]|uniref:Uncharacterized protein, UPF0160 family n=1 Tax=Pseudobacteriovorax antillogorgiicola TaxID=1513793 RepID=A0A1Y6BPE2_9BACT|nr:MYG1 family protein [Pseudobacteriovorax antillogorgiicola]TCS55378.1 uncharacterized UPF0160 family protein [Pseudobacteriovorax antillogorgiicola]SMF13279.1 Uncharacterized protein, UPF0160 family [Pseudobacteriovorax antillogorgiicola]
MKFIGTHDGRFHCDEVLAIAQLKILPQFQSHGIKRTRNLEILASCDVLVDVGGAYDHHRKRYDHHQREFNTRFSENYRIQLSSAGLVYLHYGLDIIKQRYSFLNPTDQEWIHKRLYDRFILAIDGLDNGIDAVDGTPLYHDPSGLPTRVHMLNCHNREKGIDLQNYLFLQGVETAQNEFLTQLAFVAEQLLPSYKELQNHVAEHQKAINNWQILEIPHGVAWEEHIDTVNPSRNIAYVFWQDEKKMWCIQTPRAHPNSFKSRMPFPEPWRGLTNDDLAKVSGVNDAKFCHRSGFFGVTSSRDAALIFMEKSILEQK